MINPKTGLRELAYVAEIKEILPITNSNNCECAVINGWNVMVRKESHFQPHDLVVYFEIDSKVDVSKPYFAFLSKYDGKIKTQRYSFGKKDGSFFLSQGLVMPLSDFGWSAANHPLGTFVTKELNVTYSAVEDNVRKGVSSTSDKFKSMTQRNQDIFSKPFFKFLIKYKIGKKLCFLLFNKRNFNNKTFPKHFPYVKVTDEERCESIPEILNDKRLWVVTEKLDGTSSTYILERKGKRKFEFYVLSRRVRQLTPNQDCYHEENVYWKMAKKYSIEEKMRDYLITHPDLSYVCIQGETVGINIQGNPLQLKDNDLYVYNFITSKSGRLFIGEGINIVEKQWNMKWVPIVGINYQIPSTMEELKKSADGYSTLNPNVLREGFVYRYYDEKTKETSSFKNVSNMYLLSKKE